MIRISLCALFGAALAMAVYAGGSEVTVGTEVGQLYPDYLLPSLDGGKPMSLSDFRGKKIVLHQFASW